MKKIINGKMYNTATAERIYGYEHCYTSDFCYTHEVLYRKKTGEFFLFGEGGPLSKYARHYGNGDVGWGEEWRPLTDWEAKAWLEENGDADTYIELFGEPDE